MAAIREHFKCPACAIITRTDWSNTYLSGGGYDPNNLSCPACSHTPLAHHAIEVEDGSDATQSMLSTTGQEVLNGMRATP